MLEAEQFQLTGRMRPESSGAVELIRGLIGCALHAALPFTTSETLTKLLTVNGRL